MPKLIPVINKRGEILYLDPDNENIVPDGYGIRTSMLLMDGVQRSIATVTDAWGAPAGHRPGYIFDTHAEARNAARAAYIKELENAWRGSTPAPVPLDSREAAYEEHKAWLADAWRTKGAAR